MVANGQVQNFHQLIGTNEIFIVPDFQRNYSWDKDRIEPLIDDLEKSTESDEPHFLGSLILLHDSSKPGFITVVDGQQRLTTIFLLVAAIRDAANAMTLDSIPGGPLGAPINVSQSAQKILSIAGPNPKFRFQAHPMIKEMVQKHVWAYPGPDRPVLPSKHYNFTLPLRKAHKQIKRTLELKLAQFDNEEKRLRFLNSLLETIEYRFHVLNVQTNDRVESYEIFMTLNSRGMPLGPSDLVKSEIFKHLIKDLPRDEVDSKSNELTADWKVIIDNLEKGDVDQFLRHYLVSVSEKPVTSKVIFRRVEDRINKEAEDPAAEAEVLLRELIRNSDIYGQLLTGEVPYLPEVEPRLKVLSGVTDSYRVFLLPVLDPKIALTDEERIELVRLTEALALRWIITGKNAQKLEDLFQECAVELRLGGPGMYDTVSRSLKASMPENDIVRPQFKDVVESRSLVRGVLHSINRVWDQTNVIPLDGSKLHVEHIAPEKPTKHWMDVLFPNDEAVDREAEYGAAIDLWGNQTLLDAKINQSIKQNDFLSKARGLTDDDWTGYHHSSVEITRDLGQNLNSWDRDEITKRSEWIADCFVKLFGAEDKAGEVLKYSKFRAS